MSTPNTPRSVKSFVLRQGRMTTGQKSALSRLYDTYCLNTENLNTTLKTLTEPLALEIGFGMGDALLHYAKTHPHVLWLGIEVHAPGVGRVLNEMEKQEITNIRIIQDDAVMILKNYIPDHSLERVHLFFPDPWPKARHHKRRIVNAAFIKLLALKLQPQGILHMATDWANYAEWMRDVMMKQNFFKLQNETPNNRPLTKFEQRGIKLGHSITDLCYEKI